MITKIRDFFFDVFLPMCMGAAVILAAAQAFADVPRNVSVTITDEQPLREAKVQACVELAVKNTLDNVNITSWKESVLDVHIVVGKKASAYVVIAPGVYPTIALTSDTEVEEVCRTALEVVTTFFSRLISIGTSV